jgi:urea transport system substrate-binding protein
VQGRTKQILLVIGVVAVYAGVASAIYAEIISTQIIDQKQDSELFVPVSDPDIQFDEDNPIKVGILHSLSGTLAASETPVVDSILLAIDEINERGGVLGRKIVPIVADGKSDWDVYSSEAEKLIVEEKVSAVFGAYTSASRKAVLPIFEEYNHLLFYPVFYEGLEQSPNIIYLGAAPNQQIIPAIDWISENIGTRIFLVGSDYVWPRSANEIVKYRASELGVEIVGEEYRILGDQDFAGIVEKIVETNPDAILDLVIGDSNFYFFKELRRQGIEPHNIPTITLTGAALEQGNLQGQSPIREGDYAAWNYFHSIDLPENKVFVQNFKNKYGSQRITNDPMEAAYVAVYLFEKAVQKAGSDDVNEIRQAAIGLTFAAPGGVVGIDPETQHIFKTFRVAQIIENNEFKIIHSTEEPIKPIPYPKYKSEEEWEVFLKDLYDGWDQNWSNLGES